MLMLLCACLTAFATAPTKAQGKRGIRSIDFRNYTYPFPFLWTEEKKLTFHNGRAPKTASHSVSEVVSVSYRDFDGDGREEAVVVIGTDCYASCWYVESYYVFTHRNGRPKVVFNESREQPNGLRERVAVSQANRVFILGSPYGLHVRGKKFVIIAPSWDELDGHCCPTHIETVFYTWRKNRFMMTSRYRKKLKTNDS
ncbi:MAG: hypothetical protein ACR2G4_12315 [Pyrinomonadaceae bacterium]